MGLYLWCQKLHHFLNHLIDITGLLPHIFFIFNLGKQQCVINQIPQTLRLNVNNIQKPSCTFRVLQGPIFQGFHKSPDRSQRCFQFMGYIGNKLPTLLFYRFHSRQIFSKIHDQGKYQ